MAGHAGFDTDIYPGDAVMHWLRHNTNLVWTGFYLAPAPNHGDASWMSRRATLLAQGWGLAPVYLGRQITGKGLPLESAHQGIGDGDNAAALMAQAGFPAGSCVYLDLENGPPCPALQQGYVSNWVGRVVAAGYKPGVYCSHTFAQTIAGLSSAARIWAFKVPTTDDHAIPGATFGAADPAGSGYAHAAIWQFEQNATITVPGVPGGQLKVDLDTATMADPSV